MLEDVLDLVQGFLEREVSGGLAAGGFERRAARADGGVVELDFLSVVVRAEERMEGVGPALDGVHDAVVNDREVVFRAA